MVAILQTWWWVVVRGIEKPVRLLAADAGDDLFLDRSGGLLVAVELHGVGGSTLSARAQLGRVAEHLRQRDVGADDLAAATLDRTGVGEGKGVSVRVSHGGRRYIKKKKDIE